MKKTMKIYAIFATALVLGSVSCSKFDEMSKNPYALESAPAESYVHPIMFNTQYNLISVFRGTTVFLSQYAVSTSSEVSSRVIGNYNIPEGTSDDVWTGLYPQYGNAMAMYTQAVAEKNDKIMAVALILRSFIITQLTDTYGDIPFKEAGLLSLRDDEGNYTTRYDSQKEIYKSVICMLETANSLLAKEDKTIAFNSICDKTFDGNYEKWRRFGNSLYARVLMRIGMKVMEEDGGVLQLDDDQWESVNIANKLSEMYSCFTSGGGEYPMMRSRDDRPLIPFSDQNETEHTPFFSTTSGIWNTVAVCDVLTRRMLSTKKGVDEFGITYYESVLSNSGGHREDPRYDCWWRKIHGMPNHLTGSDVTRFLASPTHRSNSDNSVIGRMVRGKDANGNDEPSAITGKVYDLKNAPYYPLMQYSELMFIFAEAGVRGWIGALSSFGAYLSLFKEAVTESIMEWNPYVTADSDEVVEYLNHVVNGELYSGSTLNTDNALEAVLTQKWLSTFFIGIESWCDYRRTGYPLLRTDGPAAGNDHILPTRLRYPSDEPYRNPEYYQEAVNGWLGGTNNIQTDVWWAATEESFNTRLLGRQ
ncbi:MAG: SusD/RagB family nutrient-binding outer membrane lipoprotein [Bacteroidales bacterium]|nr:SusD/RagB family nutrient-binding outer membrane lipoprotein [Bacteroidales bacterium]